MTAQSSLRAGIGAALVLLIALAVTAAPARAQKFNCNLRFEGVGDAEFEGAGGRGYDPFSAANGMTAVDLTVRNVNNNGCNFFITASTGQAGSYDRIASAGGGKLRYNVYTGPSAGAELLRDIYDSTASSSLSQFIGGKERITLRYYIDVPSLQLVEQGDYRDTLEFGLYAGFPGVAHDQKDSNNVTIEVPVIPVIDVELAAGGLRLPLDGASVVLDFGNLRTRDSREFNLFVRGNAPYRLEIFSENAGVLRLEDYATEHNTIPYELSIDGSRRSLGGPILLSYGTLGSGARQHRGRITIGDFDTVLRGTYSDVLTVTITAN